MIPLSLKNSENIQVLMVPLPTDEVHYYEMLVNQFVSYQDCMKCCTESERESWRLKVCAAQTMVMDYFREMLTRQVGQDVVQKLVEVPQIDFWGKKALMVIYNENGIKEKCGTTVSAEKMH